MILWAVCHNWDMQGCYSVPMRMDSHALPKVSFCTTCKGRSEHLKQTLPANMKAERGNPNLEFVVLDYGDADGLGEWIRAQFSDEIASGRLRYARSEQPYFRMAHAKNLSHRVATGDVLCNVDADNFVVPGFAGWLQEQFADNPRSFVSSIPLDAWQQVRRKLGRDASQSLQASADIVGRMAIGREDFLAMGGYRERYSGWGGEDLDYALRARDRGMQVVTLPQRFHGSAIAHDDQLRVAEFSPGDRKRSEDALYYERHGGVGKTASRFVDFARYHGPYAHRGNIGCATVEINFGAPQSIRPVPEEPKPSWQESVAAGHALGKVERS